DDAQFVALQRRDQPQVDSALTALARLFVTGQHVEWPALYAGTGARVTDLPTYPFQHRPYWLPLTPSGAQGPAGLGLSAPGHPMLTTAMELAGGDGSVFVGRLSLHTHPWLADHRVGTTVTLPPAALVELAVRAGDEAGCSGVAELATGVPLTVPDRGAVQVQLALAAPDEDGARRITIGSRPDGDDPSGAWEVHATGLLTEPAQAPLISLAAWPPADATPVALDGLYERLREQGRDYGPVFQGLRALWRRGDDLYAEVRLPEETEPDTFGIHPALLDSALHALLADGQEVAGLSWHGFHLHATGSRGLRVRIRPTGADAVRLWLADETGEAVAEVNALRRSPAESTGRPDSVTGDSLFHVVWSPVALPDPDDLAPTLLSALGDTPLDGLARRVGSVAEAAGDVLVAVLEEASGDDPAAAAHRAGARALELVQQALAFETSRLVLVTTNAVATDDGEDVALALAPVWGLVRSAQVENPGRVTLIDLDGSTASAERLPAAIAAGHEQLAVRAGRASTPRLARVRTSDPGAGRPVPDPQGTVLITGGTGALGALFARHLVTDYGVRHLLLAGRRGPDAPGADRLTTELTELGATVRIEACDTADRTALDHLIRSIPDTHPLTGVVHTAGVIDDGILTALTPDRLTTVLRPKTDAAWHLHELTRHHPLTMFVLFSS
ncbi:type I polyketide synthase, partial [Streptomyces tendae]|uniref:type I polyketide synthase n=1 Tax=Streptomyces tendae TaxID=1932 RepID=UPI0038301503